MVLRVTLYILTNITVTTNTVECIYRHNIDNILKVRPNNKWLVQNVSCIFRCRLEISCKYRKGVCRSQAAIAAGPMRVSDHQRTRTYYNVAFLDLEYNIGWNKILVAAYLMMMIQTITTIPWTQSREFPVWLLIYDYKFRKTF